MRARRVVLSAAVGLGACGDDGGADAAWPAGRGRRGRACTCPSARRGRTAAPACSSSGCPGTGPSLVHQHYNLGRARKAALASGAAETLQTWLKLSAPLFVATLTAPNSSQTPTQGNCGAAAGEGGALKFYAAMR